jgi:hypothetical protein
MTTEIWSISNNDITDLNDISGKNPGTGGEEV